MNRIILIGNGFDLAHGLETKYEQLIADFWRQFSEKIINRSTPNNLSLQCYSDEFVRFTFNEKYIRFHDQRFMKTASSFKEVEDILNQHKSNVNWHIKGYPSEIVDGGISLTFQSEFFEAINKKLTEQKWVDIENEYYRLLKELHDRHSRGEDIDAKLKKLNTELAAVKKKLIDYLKNKTGVGEENPDTTKIIYEPIDPQDISCGDTKLFLDDLASMSRDECPIDGFLFDNPEYEFAFDKDKAAYEIMNVMLKKGKFDKYLVPEQTLILNFNYTSTAGKYLEGHDDVQINQIHGELGDDKNPVIFGYGDEMDETYKRIAEQNENEYLTNIKSIRYLETDNYRRLLTFIDSAPYQIYVMGHSCGNSDRTLLNTLFEHDNCVSIKPFFYKKSDGTDDYIDIVQNISRNFRDPALMRDRVVNKTFCSPLPQKNG